MVFVDSQDFSTVCERYTCRLCALLYAWWMWVIFLNVILLGCLLILLKRCPFSLRKCNPCTVRSFFKNTILSRSITYFLSGWMLVRDSGLSPRHQYLSVAFAWVKRCHNQSIESCKSVRIWYMIFLALLNWYYWSKSQCRCISMDETTATLGSWSSPKVKNIHVT